MLSAGSCGSCHRVIKKHGWPTDDGKYLLCGTCTFPRKQKRRRKKK